MRGNFVFFFIIGVLVGLVFREASATAEETANQKGLVWVFYNDPGRTRPVSSGIEYTVDVDTGTRYSDYGKVWRGRILAPASGRVVFRIEADNGARVFIDDQIVIDGWTMEGPLEGVFEFLEGGRSHKFRVEYFQEGGVGFVRLYWRPEGGEIEIVPSSAFTHTAEDMAFAEKELGGILGVEKIPVTDRYARLHREGAPPSWKVPIRLTKGPHLFLDDHLIARSQNLQRVVNRPERDPGIPNPIVTGKENGCFQPYLTVLHDPDADRFRIWYGCRTEDFNTGRSHIAYMESTDGVRWQRPHRVLEDPDVIQFGIAVVDDGARSTDPESRFKFGWYMDGGFKVATSPDGLRWTPIRKDPLVLHNHDITGLWFDPLRSKYLATLSVYRSGEDWSGNRRITMHAYSNDLLNWSEPRYVLLPDSEVDSGETQFYAMDGYLERGGLVIGMVKVLRDDLKADDPPDPPDAYGVGYTSLAWTHDGETWYRDPEHFFDPHPDKNQWDHAHAWIDEQLPVGNEVYLYYGGYKRGHKVNRFEERQIGLVTMKRDRYVAREAAESKGFLRTRTVLADGERLTLNVEANRGEARVQVIDSEGNPIPGFEFSDCNPITLDSVEAPVEWGLPFADLAGKEIAFEISLENARLFALGID